MSSGAILGPVIYGFLSVTFGAQYGFIFAAMALAWVAWFYSRYLGLYQSVEQSQSHHTSKRTIAYLYLGTLPVIALIYLLLTHLKLFDDVAFCVGGLTIIAVLAIAFFQKQDDLKKMIFLLLLNMFAIFYYACLNQISSSVMLFISLYSHSGHLAAKIPSQIFAALEPTFGIISAPFLAKYLASAVHKLRFNRLLLLKVFLGLLAACLSFWLFKLAADVGAHDQSWFFFGIIIGNFFLGIGEMLIGPALLSAVAYLIIKKYQGTFMGIWSLFIAFSGYFGAWIARVTAVEGTNIESIALFSKAFGIIALMMVGVLLVFVLLQPLFKTLVADV